MSGQGKTQENRARAARTDLTQGSPARSLLLFAFPLILGNLFQQFYNMADSMIVGNFVSEDALAAVGASYALTTVFIMIAIGGGNGASVLTSQYLGAGNYRRMRTSVSTALLTFLVLSIVLAAVGLLFNHEILVLLKTPDNILEQAELYLGIYFLGLPFLFMYNILASMFNAIGDSRTPLFLLIFSSLLNVALDIISVTWLAMGVDGVAIATVIAQGISAVLALFILIGRLRSYGRMEEAGEKAGDKAGEKAGGTMPDRAPLFDRSMLWTGTKIAIPTILQQSIVSIGMLLVQSVVNEFGSGALAGYSAASRIESICIVPMIATGNAVATFTAQNIGAGKLDRVRRGYRASYGIIAVFAVVIAVILALFNEPIISGFLGGEPSPEALATGTGYLSFIGYFVFLLGAKSCSDGVLRGAGDMVVFTLGNLVNLTIRVAAAFYFAPIVGVAAVWYVVPAGWLANYSISFARYLSGRWKKKRVI